MVAVITSTPSSGLTDTRAIDHTDGSAAERFPLLAMPCWAAGLIGQRRPCGGGHVVEAVFESVLTS
jgi:hypothetical protein